MMKGHKIKCFEFQLKIERDHMYTKYINTVIDHNFIIITTFLKILKNCLKMLTKIFTKNNMYINPIFFRNKKNISAETVKLSPTF